MSQFCNAVWVQMLRTAEQSVRDQTPDMTDQQASEAAAEQVRSAIDGAGPVIA